MPLVACTAPTATYSVPVPHHLCKHMMPPGKVCSAIGAQRREMGPSLPHVPSPGRTHGPCSLPGTLDTAPSFLCMFFFFFFNSGDTVGLPRHQQWGHVLTTGGAVSRWLRCCPSRSASAKFRPLPGVLNSVTHRCWCMKAQPSQPS